MSVKTAETTKALPSVKTSQKLALGFGDFGYSIVSCTVATYIVTFGTMAVGVPGTLMGIAAAIGTVFDAISDPIVGYLSDNSKNKFFGKRHLFVLIGLIGMILTSIFIWAVPVNASNLVKFIWFAIGLTVLKTFNTLYYTPISAFSVEISDDYNERTMIQSIRSIFYIVGMILPVILMGSFQNKYAYTNSDGVLVKGQMIADGYVDFAYVGGAIALITTVLIFVMTFSNVPRLRIRSERQERLSGAEKPSLKKVIFSFFSVLKDKDMRIVTFGYAISMISATLIIAIGFHVFTFTFKTTTMQMYIVMASLLLMTIGGQPIWAKLAKKFDKKRSMIIGLFISLTGCILLFFVFLMRGVINEWLVTRTPLAMILLMLPLMCAGLGTGVLYSMPLALIGDIVARNSAKGGNEQTGTYAGMMTFSYKISQSLTQLLSGTLLSAIGFISGAPTQTEEVAGGLGWILCIGVIIPVVCGIIIYSKLKLDKDEISKILAEKASGAGFAEIDSNSGDEETTDA